MELDLDDPRVLLRADVVEDPRPLYDLLREVAPVWRIPGQDTYLVSGPALIRDAVARPEDFSSNLVSLLHDDGTGCPVPFPLAPYGDPIHVLATADPPLHTRHRRLLQSHLSPAAVAALEPAIGQIVGEHLDRLPATGHVDLVATFADPVPARTVCELIGLPHADAARIVGMVAATGALLDGVTDADGMRRASLAALELTVYVQDQLDAALARTASQRSGLLAVFGDGIDAGALSMDEVRSMLVVLVSAGSETTASLLATSLETLARDADRQGRLRRAPELISDAIEDILRSDGPFQFHYRWAVRSSMLGTTEIPAGSRVLLMWAAANRPASCRMAPAPPSGRGPAPHFAFGRGLHFCIGAPVARLEARIALEAILGATASITLDADRPPARRPSIFLRRHATLPAIVTRA